MMVLLLMTLTSIDDYWWWWWYWPSVIDIIIGIGIGVPSDDLLTYSHSLSRNPRFFVPRCYVCYIPPPRFRSDLFGAVRNFRYVPRFYHVWFVRSHTRSSSSFDLSPTDEYNLRCCSVDRFGIRLSRLSCSTLFGDHVVHIRCSDTVTHSSICSNLVLLFVVPGTTLPRSIYVLVWFRCWS